MHMATSPMSPDTDVACWALDYPKQPQSYYVLLVHDRFGAVGFSAFGQAAEWTIHHFATEEQASRWGIDSTEALEGIGARMVTTPYWQPAAPALRRALAERRVDASVLASIALGVVVRRS